MAVPRSPGGNTLAMIDSVEGMTNAAATPMTARAPMIMPAVSATTAIAEPARNSASPNCSAPLRPNRSPSVPALNSRPANTRA
jgi:hypothetical protein